MQPWWRRLDLPLLLCTAVLALLGLAMIYSATGLSAGPGTEVNRQAMMIALGLVGMAFFTMVDYRVWRRMGPLFFVLLVGLLVAVLVVGTSAKGAQRWIELGPLGTFQPSEPAKLLLILSLARMLAGGEDDDDEEPGASRFLMGLAMMGAAMVLVMLQPDLGTALATAGIGMVMLYGAGMPLKWLLGMIAAGLAAFPFVLHDYQRERILVFLNPEADPTGSGWNLMQSRIAIGSGGFWGTGLFHGTQNQLNFVPEHHTDFIFTVVGEELGFVGCVSVLLLFAYIVGHALRTSEALRDRYGSLLALGIGTLFSLHVVINTGMTMGLMPVAGIPLPFLSYGGSAVVTNLCALGILNSLWMRRPRTPD